MKDKLFVDFHTVVVSGRERKKTVKNLAVEGVLSLYINGKFYSSFLLSPTMEREFVYGHLIAEGIVSSVNEILEVKFSDGEVYVQLTSHLNSDKLRKYSSTACGELAKLLSEFKSRLNVVHSDMVISDSQVREISEILNRESQVYRKTGGVHVVAVFDRENKPIIIVEDVGRHNALDKVIGYCVLNGYSTDRLILACSGRITTDMVLKAARMKFPIVISLSAPTANAVEIAKSLGISLIGFARGSKFNLYTHPERIR